MRSVRVVLVGGLTAAAIVVLAACSSAPSSTPTAAAQAGGSTSEPTPVATVLPAIGTSERPARVAVVGDSLTAGGARLLSEGLTPDTWMTYAQGDGIDYVGGWARGGRTVQVMAQNVRPIRDVDVLVLMAGTNDVRLHIPFSQSYSSYDSIVSTIHAKHVIIGALPPYDRNPDGAAAYDRQLRAYAVSKGWDFVDPWGFARDGKIYAAGVSADGIHPVTAGYEKLGHNYREAILRVVEKPQKG